MPRNDDFLVRRAEKNAQASPSADAQFTYFGPVGVQDRYRFLVVKETGDDISVTPIRDAKFSVGLQAWRWKEAEGGSPETWLVIKTKPSRVDLKRVPKS